MVFNSLFNTFWVFLISFRQVHISIDVVVIKSMKRLPFTFPKLSRNKMIVIKLILLVLLALICGELVFLKRIIRISLIGLGLATFLSITYIILLLKWANLFPRNFILVAIIRNVFEVIHELILVCLFVEWLSVCHFIILCLDILWNSVGCLSHLQVFHYWNCWECWTLVLVKFQFSAHETVLAVFALSGQVQQLEF